MTKKNKKDIFSSKNLNKNPSEKNTYNIDHVLDSVFGKEGTKKRELNRKKAMVLFRAEDLINERKESGLTQQEIADKLGKDKTYISKIENGKVTPSVDLFYRYVQAIGKRVEIV
ncbi:transcriptional regulator [Candidatus Campbellbacteria bacterium]|nr:MAG: transcriptional regulator [Candidatus Campbellbacteria bacterium]